jgi:hypothetical protein
MLAVLVLGAVALPARAGDAPLAQLPADTPVVLSLRGVEGTKQRLATMIKNALPDVGDGVVSQLDAVLEKALDGRKLTGLAADGPVFLTLQALPQPGAPPDLAIVARVTDYKAFRDGFLKEDERKNLKKQGGYEVTTIDGKEAYLLHREGYVVLAAEKAGIEKFAGAQGTGFGARVGKGVAARLLESDVALYVDMTAVNKAYGDQIQGVRPLIPLFLDQAAEQTQGQLDKTTVKFAKAFIEGAFQAVQDSRHVLVALSFKPQGLALHVGAGLTVDSPTNKFLKENKPAALSPAGLPPGFFTYTAMAFGPEAFKTFMPAAVGMLGSEGANEEEVRKAMDQLVAAGPGLMLMAGGSPNHGLYVSQFKDAAKATDAQL